MRRLLCCLFACIALSVSAQFGNVAFIEQLGNDGATCVFTVTTPPKPVYVPATEGKGSARLTPEEFACREVLNAILFDGVENYNDGKPLVTNANDAFARSLVNPKTKVFMTYFKKIEVTDRINEKIESHFTVDLNNYNLLRLLKMRGSI